MNRKAVYRLVLGFFLGSMVSSSFADDTSRFDHALWDQLLNRHVVEIRSGVATQLDYKGVSSDRKLLDGYLESMERVTMAEFTEWPSNDQLAFLINAYNAWTVALILRSYPDIESIKELGNWFASPWSKAFIPLLGEVRSLDDIEHGLIRGAQGFNEPRIHFAVNCASVGCPALRGEAYLGDRLDAQLEDALRLFLNDATRNRWNDGDLEVSKIFKWYEDDFVSGWRGHNNLKSVFKQYANELNLTKEQIVRLKSNQFDVVFSDYDWSLNDQKH